MGKRNSRQINMALQSASTTIKLFSLARNPLISSLSAGSSIAAKNADQKRFASGGNYVYINPIKDNPSWGEISELLLVQYSLLKLSEDSQSHLDKCSKNLQPSIIHSKKGLCHQDLEESML